MPFVAIALGSNLGDRQAALTYAIDRLTPLLADISVSQAIETEPEGDGLEGQPLYLNAAVVGTTSLDARALLLRLLETERRFGRERPYDGAPRTLDLDLILYGDAVLDEPDL
ncbi:MAG TPA: 2-amino-4-hydroxy-6-hydroxymethyldihydropteridine diphosphokinase, partial [Vicinamibacterales bacterium]